MVAKEIPCCARPCVVPVVRLCDHGWLLNLPARAVTFEAARDSASELNGGAIQTNMVVPADAIGAHGNSVPSTAACARRAQARWLLGAI
jgi:hypothetical protein